MAGLNIVITGTSRGIGLELVKQALEQGNRVLAVARSPQKSLGLSQLLKEHEGALQTLAADVSQDETPSQIFKAASESFKHVDVLINNAGIYNDDDTAADFMESFRVNSVAPFLITRELLPLLKKSSHPKVLHLTSQMGSIADNSSGGSYSYRSSKAALNMISKSLSIDFPWLATAVAHPGWVQTEMGGSHAPTPAKESAAGLWRLIDSLDQKKSGGFFTYKGQTLPW